MVFFFSLCYPPCLQNLILWWKVQSISASKPFQFAGISPSNVSWIVSYIHLDIQAVCCRCYVELLCITSTGNPWGWFRWISAELNRALKYALVSGSTYLSRCLNAYSFNAFYIAGKPQFIYQMTDAHLQWDTRLPTHPWTATLLCYTGRPIWELVMTELSQCFLTCVV